MLNGIDISIFWGFYICSILFALKVLTLIAILITTNVLLRIQYTPLK